MTTYVPRDGERIIVFSICQVTVPEEGAKGYVIESGIDSFRFMPDLPDPTRNFEGQDARTHNSKSGWIMHPSNVYHALGTPEDTWVAEDYLIVELML